MRWGSENTVEHPRVKRGSVRFEVYEDDKGKWLWLLRRAADGRIVYKHERAYFSEYQAWKAIEVEERELVQRFSSVTDHGYEGDGLKDEEIEDELSKRVR